MAESSIRGTQGIHRVESARPLEAGTLSLSFTSEFSQAKDFFVTGDSNRRLAQHLNVAGSFYKGLDLWLGWSHINNTTSGADEPLQYSGDPTLGLKYSFALGKTASLAAVASMMVPTAEGGSGLAFDALTVTGLLVASVTPTSWLTLALNGGYRMDQTKKLFGHTLTPAQRYTAQVSQVSYMLAGAGASASFSAGPSFSYGGYLEASGGLGSGVKFDNNPIWATAALRFSFLRNRNLEFALGSDVRVAGAPTDDDRVPGVAPWQAFARIGGSLNFLNTGDGPQVCQVDADCSSGMVCGEAGYCAVVQVKEVTKEKEVVKEVVKVVEEKKATFIIAGGVVDLSNGAGVQNSTITISGFETTPLTVDAAGKFRTWPLEVNDGLVKLKIEAPGYKPAEQTLPRGPVNTVAEVEIKLAPIGLDIPGTVRGSLSSARSGKPVAGLVFIPSLGKKLKTDKKGAFTVELPRGTYQIVFSAPKHAPQTKEVIVNASEVVIMNIDMAPKR